MLQPVCRGIRIQLAIGQPFFKFLTCYDKFTVHYEGSYDNIPTVKMADQFLIINSLFLNYVKYYLFQGCFVLLTDLVSVAPGALANHCGAIIPGTLVSLTLVHTPGNQQSQCILIFQRQDNFLKREN